MEISTYIHPLYGVETAGLSTYFISTSLALIRAASFWDRVFLNCLALPWICSPASGGITGMHHHDQLQISLFHTYNLLRLLINLSLLNTFSVYFILEQCRFTVVFSFTMFSYITYQFPLLLMASMIHLIQLVNKYWHIIKCPWLVFVLFPQIFFNFTNVLLCSRSPSWVPQHT